MPRQIFTNIYKFFELDEDAKEKALDEHMFEQTFSFTPTGPYLKKYLVERGYSNLRAFYSRPWIKQPKAVGFERCNFSREELQKLLPLTESELSLLGDSKNILFCFSGGLPKDFKIQIPNFLVEPYKSIEEKLLAALVSLSEDLLENITIKIKMHQTRKHYISELSKPDCRHEFYESGKMYLGDD